MGNPGAVFGSTRLAFRSGGIVLLATLVIDAFPATGLTAEPASQQLAERYQRLQLAERRQLTRAEILKKMVGRTMVREMPDFPLRGGGTARGAMYFIMRPDGSFLFKCEWYNLRVSSWVKCIGLKEGQLRGGFTNGTWRLRGNLFCIHTTTQAGEFCVAVSETNDGVHLNYASGRRPAVFFGAFRLVNEARPQCIGHLKATSC